MTTGCSATLGVGLAMAVPETTKKAVKIEVNETMMIGICLKLSLMLVGTVAVEVAEILGICATTQHLYTFRQSNDSVLVETQALTKTSCPY